MALKPGCNPALGGVTLPSRSWLDGDPLYAESGAADRLHLDVLEPRLGPAASFHKSSVQSRRLARPVRVLFSAGERALGRARTAFPRHQVRPMVWNSGPYFAWVRDVGGVRLLDHGETRRGRSHDARIAGAQPAGVELAQAFAAAELVHWGRLEGASLKAEAEPGVAAEIRQAVRIGRRAPWHGTLAQALSAALIELVRRGRLRITVASGPMPLAAFEEMRTLVLMEWSHRLAGRHPLSLPASSLSGLIQDRNVDLGIVWRDGDQVPLRVVRSVHYESIGLDSPRPLLGGVGVGLLATRAG